MDHEQLNDAQIVAKTLQDNQNFRYIIQRYEAKLTRYIRRMSNFSPEEIEDVLQDIFIKVYQNLNAYDQDQKFSSWIYRIAHNHIISTFRKKKARPEPAFSNDDEDIFESIASDEDIRKNIDMNIAKNKIGDVLASMDEKYREALVLKYLEEYDYKEISFILKKPMGTIATLINRAKKQFIKKAQELNITLEYER